MLRDAWHMASHVATRDSQRQRKELDAGLQVTNLADCQQTPSYTVSVDAIVLQCVCMFGAHFGDICTRAASFAAPQPTTVSHRPQHQVDMLVCGRMAASRLPLFCVRQAHRLRSDPGPVLKLPCSLQPLDCVCACVCCQPVPMWCSLDVFFLPLVDVVWCRIQHYAHCQHFLCMRVTAPSVWVLTSGRGCLGPVC